MPTESEISKAQIVNAALVMELGLPAAFSIDADDNLAGIVAAVWPALIDEVFALHDWTWARRTEQLERLANTPVTGWSYAFELPGDRVGDPLALSRFGTFHGADLVREFYLEGSQVHCNEPILFARCKVLVDPVAWDPGFRAAFRKALGSALAIPMTHDVDLKAELKGEAFGSPSQGGAGGMFGRLIAQNRASQPMPGPFSKSDLLTDARWS